MQKFSDYVILGTHDSGACLRGVNRLIAGFGPGGAIASLISSAFICQDYPVSEQFDIGVRFFDLRINEDLNIIHGSSSPAFDSLENILYLIQEKVREKGSFAIISLKFDDGKWNNLSSTSQEKLNNLILGYQNFDNEYQEKISGMYLFNRINGLPRFPYVDLKDDGYTTTEKNFYIQDCYRFTEITTYLNIVPGGSILNWVSKKILKNKLIKYEWESKVESIEKCDRTNSSKIKINFTSFVKGDAIPDPVAFSQDVNKWLIKRSTTDFSSTVYVVDGVDKNLSSKFKDLNNFLL